MEGTVPIPLFDQLQEIWSQDTPVGIDHADKNPWIFRDRDGLRRHACACRIGLVDSNDLPEEIALKFYAQVSYGADIERVTVNGAEYEVQKTEGSSEYTVQLPAVNTPGVQAFHITKVSLNSGQEVEVDYCIVQCQKL